MNTHQPPPLDDIANEWVDAADLAHLPSLRNQWGQAHVNADLTSLSWLAIPPYAGGYHTGVLRVDGQVVAAEQFRWAPWGVTRVAHRGGLNVEADVRLGFEATRVSWRITIGNPGPQPRMVRLDQELLAPIAHSEVDWGWTYGTPWNYGHYHDYFATERIRAEVLADKPRQVQLLPHDARYIRLGSPRIPGTQRDEQNEPMLLESSLPDHSPADSGRVRAPSILATISGITVTSRDGDTVTMPNAHVLDSPTSEIRLDAVRLNDGSTIAFRICLDRPCQTGVVLTHGNHPDSLQIGLDAGRPWIIVGGEREIARQPLGAGEHEFIVVAGLKCVRLLIDDVEQIRTHQWWRGSRWSAFIDGGAVVVVDSASPARCAYGFAQVPDRLVIDGFGALARWESNVQPGCSVTVSYVLDIGDDQKYVTQRARTWPAHISDHDDVAQQWRDLWNNAFRPGNPDHSGHMPVLEADPDLQRTYYLGVLLALYLRNTGVSPLGPVFLTGGPRLGPTTTFFWDLAEWPHTAALLEPEGLRTWILAALAQPYDTCHSFDTRNLLPVGNHYAANDYALFHIIDTYISVTGDRDLLDQSTGGLTVLDHLRTFAYRPRTRRADFGAGILVDFGPDTWELLECVPNYRNAVVSFNAGYVGMLRAFAALLRRLGVEREAALAERDADELARAVLGQYAGDGRWRIAHPDGEEAIGHCLDFELVAANMADDLPATVRAEMVGFVTSHLIDGDWMRALSPDDPVAPWSDRPDHGAAGAFAAWPGATSYGLCQLARRDLAAAFLRRVHRSRSGALWGQAQEAVGNGRYRTAERGVSNRESVAAAAVTEAILVGLFGYNPSFTTPGRPACDVTSQFGTLHWTTPQT